MDERISDRSTFTVAANAAATSARQTQSRDLREWLVLIERNGLLKRIDKSVDADEELAAITFMATRREDAPALLFQNLAGDRSGSSVLANMLGASKPHRYLKQFPPLDLAAPRGL